MRKLVFCNIIMVLIALFSVVSLVFMPLLSINIGKMMGGFIDEVAPDDEEDSDTKNMLNIITSGLDADITITTVKLGKLATSEDAGVEFLTAFIFERHGIAENIILSSIVTASVEVLGDEQAKNVDYEALRDTLYKLEDDDADVAAITKEYCEELGRAGVEVSSDVTDIIQDAYDEVKAKNGGKFTIEAFTCAAMTGFADGAPTTYGALARELAAGKSFSSSEDDPLGGVGLSLIGDMVEAFADIAKYLGYGFYVMLAFLFPWVLFVLLGTLHTIIPNKRAATWYLFLFGAYPCVIFWGMPTLMKFVLPKFIGNLLGGSSPIDALFAGIGSFAWISGLCLVVLWFIWLFWMRPLKKKAKQGLL